MDDFITILLPCYNEEEAIAKVVDDVSRVMRGTQYNFEILVVDDNSSDKSLEIVEEMIKSNNNLRLVKRRVNGGSGATRKTGINNSKGSIIVMLDADGTYNADDIPEMLKYFPEYDQVNGARTSEEGTYKFIRFSAKWIIRQLAIYLSGYKIPDLNTGLKAFKKDIMMKYLWVIPDGFSCVTTMTLAFLTNGYNVKYIPTRYFKRIGKSKFHPVKDTIKFMNAVIRMVIYFNPLKFFMPLGLTLILIDIVYVAYIITFVEYKIIASQVVLFIAAIQIIIFGLLADLIISTTKRDR